MTTMGDDVLAQLGEHGLDVNTRYEMEFYLYFADATNAETARERVNQQGLVGKVAEEVAPNQWLVVAVAEVIPAQNVAQLNQWEADLVAITEQLQGVFDGWGANPTD